MCVRKVLACVCVCVCFIFFRKQPVRRHMQTARRVRYDTVPSLFQRLSLQRGWAEDKAGLRRAADDALRRATEGRARAEEEAAQQVMQKSIRNKYSISTVHIFEKYEKQIYT